MTEPEELNKMLTDSFEQLVECTHLVKEIPLDPKGENIYSLGKAMAEISDVLGKLYKLHPELKGVCYGVGPT